jgi:PAS domain S-box-containing protein
MNTKISNLETSSSAPQAPQAEIALRQTEERFRLFVEEAVQDYAIFVLDPEGRVATWNIGAERIKGYQPSEIIGRHFSCFYTEEDVRAGKPARNLEVAAREGRVEDEGWRVRKDGSRFWADVVITTLRDDAGKLVGFGKVTRDRTERMLADRALKEAQANLRNSEKSLRDLSLHLLRTQDEERRRIGREMHDSLGQYLSVLKMKLDSIGLSSQSWSETRIKKEIAECSRFADECVKEVRTISYLLYPPLLEEMGLKSATLWYLEGFTKRSGIKTSFDAPDDFGRLPNDVELVLFRVLQESLTNVHRHSGSPTAEIRLQRTGEAVVLTVADHGKGMPAALFEEHNRDWLGALGVGLRGMNERLQQLGGRIEIVSSEAGTVVRGIIPVSEQRPADSAQAEVTGGEAVNPTE